MLEKKIFLKDITNKPRIKKKKLTKIGSKDA
jgi:hypothetical protein